MLSYATITAILSALPSGFLSGLVLRYLGDRSWGVVKARLDKRKEQLAEEQANRLISRMEALKAQPTKDKL